MARFFEPGLRFLPLLLIMQRGFPFESENGDDDKSHSEWSVPSRYIIGSGNGNGNTVYIDSRSLPKNSRRLVAAIMTSSGGTPRTSIRQASCSTSFSPGNSG